MYECKSSLVCNIYLYFEVENNLLLNSDLLEIKENGTTELYNFVIQNIIVSKSLRKVDEFKDDDIEIIYKKMKENNIYMDIVTYHHFMQFYSRKGNYKMTMNLYNEMIKNDFEPNITTFNRLFKCLNYSNEFNQQEKDEKFHEIIEIMRNEYSVTPNIYTFMELLHFYHQVCLIQYTLSIFY